MRVSSIENSKRNSPPTTIKVAAALLSCNEFLALTWDLPYIDELILPRGHSGTNGQRDYQNPIINSPFEEPTRHFKFNDEGITNEQVDGRRISSYFVPIAKPRTKHPFDTEWTQDRIEENKLVNDIRRRVLQWRKGGYVGVTPTTARLIAYWTDPSRERKLFFCQNEALETAIYITEVRKEIRRCLD